GFAVHLTRWSDRKLKPHSVVEVFANKYLGIDLLELDVPVTSDPELLRHHPGIGHGERSGTTSLRILAGRRQETQHNVLGRAEPRVILYAAPDDHRHGAAGLEGFAHVAQPRYGVLEELRAKSRKAEIVNRFEWVCLHVLSQERDVGYACCLGVLAPEFQKCITTIDSQNRPGRAYQSGQLDRGIAKAATRVDHLIARLDRQSRKDCLTV